MAQVLRIDRLYVASDQAGAADSLNRLLDAAAAWYNGHATQSDPMAGFVWPPPKHRFTGSNQDVINLFARAAGKAAFIDWLNRAQLTNTLTANRAAPYTGPAVEDLPGLSDAEQAALIALLPPAA